MLRIIFLFQHKLIIRSGPQTPKISPQECVGPLLAGTLKLAVITVTIWIVCGTDQPGPLPDPDSAHYSAFLIEIIASTSCRPCLAVTAIVFRGRVVTILTWP